MWQIIKLYFGLVLLASAIQGDPNKALKTKLCQMGANNEAIHGKFKPLKNGLVGEGVSGVVFKGNMLSQNEMIVAMKFVKMEKLGVAKLEYEMFTYLNAVDNPNVEKFGIPNVYYYNEWNGHMITVLSYFEDGDLIDKCKHFKGTEVNQYINSLIIFRDFVLQSKYIHSRGIRHDDVKPENIMLRKHRSFLIDFNGSSKINEDNRGGTFRFLPRKFRKLVRKSITRDAKDDWESFLYTMCYIHLVPLKWFHNPRFQPLTHWESQLAECGQMKDKTEDTIAQIQKAIKSPALKRVFLKFANEAFQTDSPFPDYDGMFEVINAEIRKYPIQCFTWLKPKQIAEARRESIENPLPDIRKDIADPKKFNQVYETVNYTRFHR